MHTDPNDYDSETAADQGNLPGSDDANSGQEGA